MRHIKLAATWSLTAVCVLATSGCGITTLKGPDIAPNQPLPKDLMVNNAENPTVAAITLASYCGSLVEQQPNGTYRPLNIPAYAAGQAPTVTTVAANTSPDYHSILDQGASGDVAAQLGAGTGKFNITAEQRLEVTVAKVSFCNSQAASQDVINKAVAALAPYNVDVNNIWLINTALHTQMGVDILKSISINESAAVTPVLNFGGQNYSKLTQTETVDYIFLSGLQVKTVRNTPVGATAPVVPLPTTAPQRLLTQPPPNALTTSAVRRRQAAPPPAISGATLPGTDFKPAVDAAKAQTGILITR